MSTPKWHIEIAAALNTLYDAMSDTDISNAASEVLEMHLDKIRAMLCKHSEHTIGPDHCGRSKHDLCYTCRERPSEHPDWGYVWVDGQRWVKK